MLFEGRFGWEMYRPIGMEWCDSGIWQFDVARIGDAVARQFLTPWTSDLHSVDLIERTEHTLRKDDTHPGEWIRLVTMEQAADLKPDLVIATLAENEIGLARWAREHGAHYGIQVGNQGAPNLWPLAEFGLLSVTTPGFTPWKPHVTYRQEFDLKLFYPDGGLGSLLMRNLVMSRVQCFQTSPDYALFRATAEAVPEATFRWFGHCEPTDDLFGGNAQNTPEVARDMHRARIAWHAKRWSDGYGHVIHNWAAIGRPVFVTGDYYADKLAGPLFTDETSFNIERMGAGDIAAAVRMLTLDDDRWVRMCDAMADRFREVVDFGAEAAAIRAMLDNVLSDPVPA
jgi:hypothetical protein